MSNWLFVFYLKKGKQLLL